MLSTVCAVSFAASLVELVDQCDLACRTGGAPPTLSDLLAESAGVGLFDVTCVHPLSLKKIRNRIIMKTILQEKVKIHYSTTIWCTNPMPQAMKIPAAKAAVDKEWEKLEKIPAWNLTKVKSEQEVIDETRTSGATVHFASLMDICHLKNAELEAKHQKYEGRVVFRGDIVKDDSGSYATFTEQGSSASQMTAAKIMDIISRLLGCDGQAADAVSR